mmetsp:Transcript_17366/g.20934  ORF Transcript_17366/g.20934 Transcript_17366/m.20934 type:complete len:94 (+) Transcript_17366:1562-1843(+)|eukprot:jgi/Bigna1/63325/fgenesh1_kg.51_\
MQGASSSVVPQLPQHFATSSRNASSAQKGESPPSRPIRNVQEQPPFFRIDSSRAGILTECLSLLDDHVVLCAIGDASKRSRLSKMTHGEGSLV